MKATMFQVRCSASSVESSAFTGVRTVEPGLAELREMIDWQFLRASS
jgi:hypothetical protein